MGGRVSAFFGGSVSDHFVDLESGLTSRGESPVQKIESPIVKQRKKIRRQEKLSKKEQIFAKILKDRFDVDYNDIPEDERAELRERVAESSKRAKYLKRGENTGRIPTTEDYFYAGLNFGGKTKRRKRVIKYTRKKK
tara:strand:- start:3621 stop:4031 length:411 start_codon:yes stop_codon:yes gene_type:complete